MYSKIMISGGERNSDDNLVWRGELQVVPAVGSTITVSRNIGEPVPVSVMFNVVMHGIEIMDSNVTYIVYVSARRHEDESDIAKLRAALAKAG